MPECGYCRDCKWWDRSLPQEGWCWCNLHWPLAHPGKEDILSATEGGPLTTAPNFGCVEWEAIRDV